VQHCELKKQASQRTQLSINQKTAQHPQVVLVAAASRLALGIYLPWQTWHSLTSIFTLRGRRDTYGIRRTLVAKLVPMGAAASCVAGLALGDFHLRFVWQA